jgi:hypothetical protein
VISWDDSKADPIQDIKNFIEALKNSEISPKSEFACYICESIYYEDDFFREEKHECWKIAMEQKRENEKRATRF